MQRTLKRFPSPGGQPGVSHSTLCRRAGRACRRLLPAALLALGLALGSAVPARATIVVDPANNNSPFIVDSPFTDSITVNPGGELDIVAGGALSQTVSFGTAVTVNGGIFVMTGGEITSAGFGVVVNSGSAAIHGGTIAHTHFDSLLVHGGSAIIDGGTLTSSAGNGAVEVLGGTASISGGTIDGFTGPGVGLLVNGGTATLSGGSVSGESKGLLVTSGMATMSGGQVTGYGASGVGMRVDGGAATLSGGSASGVGPDLVVTAGTLTVVGCNLVLSPSGLLSGILQSGDLINATVSSGVFGQPALQNLGFGPPLIACPPSQTVTATSTAGAVVYYPAPGVSNACPGTAVACNPASGSVFPVGATTVTCIATDKLGQTSSCQFPVTVVLLADLQLSLMASTSSVKRGQNLTYSVTVKNAGPFPAAGVVISDVLPPDCPFVSASSASGTVAAPPPGTGGAVTCSLASPLPVGGTASLSIVVTVNARGKTTVTDTASVSSSATDPVTSNNTATVSTAVTGSQK
jgi:uncharacterized repeat protein (TIGR01451 family)